MNVKRSFDGLLGKWPTEASDKNAERDMQKAFESLGYSMKVPITPMKHKTSSRKQVTTYHMDPGAWVKHLLEDSPELLAGCKGVPKEQFRAFWAAYKEHHSEHVVFETHGAHLERVAPLLLHGDEGRGVKRTNFFVMSLESPLGSVHHDLECNCAESLAAHRGVSSYGSPSTSLDDNTMQLARAMLTNYKGHSYLSRFLLFGMGGWLYKKHPWVVQKALAEVSSCMCRLFEEGVQLANGETWYGAVVALKGDMEFHKKVITLSRSYANVGTINEIQICHHCLAGSPHYPFEDYSEDPKWEESLYRERPWLDSTLPFFVQIPFDKLAPERLLQGDLFHIFKCGVGRDIVGGVLVLLLRLKFFDFEEDCGQGMPERLDRAHLHFVLWCSVEQVSPGLRSFSKSFFNMPLLTSAPWSNSKGSDTVLLLKWLAFVVRLNLVSPIVSGHESLLQAMLQVLEAGLALRMTHGHRLFLERDCARSLYVKIMTVLRGYTHLARCALGLNIRAFVQKPKHHALHHLAHVLKAKLKQGCRLLLNPQAFACEMNEDYVGKISRLSRRVGFRKCSLRVCQKLLIKMNTLLRKRRRLPALRRIWKGKRKHVRKAS